MYSGEQGISPTEIAKFTAAKRASYLVETDMRVGLGTGSTAEWLLRCLSERMREEGLRFQGVATSERTAKQARALGISVVDFEAVGWLDLTIDGADEIDPDLNLIKGGGGALLREKIVASASDRVVVIADARKRVGRLGGVALPIEILRFGFGASCALVEASLAALDVAGRESALRMSGGDAVITENGNHILDLFLGQIGDARQLSALLNQIPGVVENGLFVDMCDMVITGHEDGRVVVHERGAAPRDEGVLDLTRGRVNLFRDL